METDSGNNYNVKNSSNPPPNPAQNLNEYDERIEVFQIFSRYTNSFQQELHKKHCSDE